MVYLHRPYIAVHGKVQEASFFSHLQMYGEEVLTLHVPKPSAPCFARSKTVCPWCAAPTTGLRAGLTPTATSTTRITLARAISTRRAIKSSPSRSDLPGPGSRQPSTTVLATGSGGLVCYSRRAGWHALLFPRGAPGPETPGVQPGRAAETGGPALETGSGLEGLSNAITQALM